MSKARQINIFLSLLISPHLLPRVNCGGICKALELRLCPSAGGDDGKRRLQIGVKNIFFILFLCNGGAKMYFLGKK
ncbi:hypothetical protein P3339_04280 [Microbulbifer sp. MLAF003]|uniref:hypothetical protein n=1 Tax=Microbulbifer sp. MLAF003 TaxID=3032582 RepID=UPI0024AE74A8|nr:hypothetical protein [Microbulbifer sp. MLAF003]WHI52042.1 hypothetical protein P3339_04280 [Microbulbifer sp. MLAF003]